MEVTECIYLYYKNVFVRNFQSVFRKNFDNEKEVTTIPIGLQDDKRNSLPWTRTLERTFFSQRYSLHQYFSNNKKII